MKRRNTNEFVEAELRDSNGQLGKKLCADVILINAPLFMGLDDVVRHEIEAIAPRNDRLAVLLETPGGSIEVAERIATVFRKHYKTIDFVVPNFAYSAGTILCMSGDNIYMDYYSVLGPIDPQVEGPNDKFVPGMGYLKKYDELVKKAENHQLSTAEMHYLISKFDAAELYVIEQARQHSVELLKQWLVKYKFKDWVETETQHIPVTQEMREQRAEHIATILNDADLWHSHGRGIPMSYLTSDDMKLKIEDFEADSALNTKIRHYYDLLSDYCGRIKAQAVIHTGNGLRKLG